MCGMYDMKHDMFHLEASDNLSYWKHTCVYAFFIVIIGITVIISLTNLNFLPTTSTSTREYDFSNSLNETNFSSSVTNQSDINYNANISNTTSQVIILDDNYNDHDDHDSHDNNYNHDPYHSPYWTSIDTNIQLVTANQTLVNILYPILPFPSNKSIIDPSHNVQSQQLQHY